MQKNISILIVCLILFVISIGCPVPPVSQDPAYAIPTGTWAVTSSSVSGGANGAGSNGSFTVSSDGSFSFSGGTIAGIDNGALVFSGKITKMTGPSAATGSLTSLTVAGATKASNLDGTIEISSVNFSFAGSTNIALTYH